MDSGSGVGKKRVGRCRYSRDFKDNAVRMVLELDKPISQVARDLGVKPGTLGHWVALWRDANGQADRPLDASERALWKADKRELAELRWKTSS